MPKHRNRTLRLGFWVTPEEKDLIHLKMAQLGTTNMSAYLRKMAIDGYAVNLDIPELKEMATLLRYSSNNLNQLAKRANAAGHIYAADLEDLRQRYDKVLDAANKIVTGLAAVR